jgi:hypothetical protein
VAARGRTSHAGKPHTATARTTPKRAGGREPKTTTDTPRPSKSAHSDHVPDPKPAKQRPGDADGARPAGQADEGNTKAQRCEAADNARHAATARETSAGAPGGAVDETTVTRAGGKTRNTADKTDEEPHGEGTTKRAGEATQHAATERAQAANADDGEREPKKPNNMATPLGARHNNGGATHNGHASAGVRQGTTHASGASGRRERGDEREAGRGAARRATKEGDGLSDEGAPNGVRCGVDLGLLHLVTISRYIPNCKRGKLTISRRGVRGVGCADSFVWGWFVVRGASFYKSASPKPCARSNYLESVVFWAGFVVAISSYGEGCALKPAGKRSCGRGWVGACF